MNPQNICNTAVEIAYAAGDLLRQSRREKKDIRRKSTTIDLVTEYDYAAERLILKRLQAAFPDHAILAEEGGIVNQTDSDFIWYVDPLDGTSNFAHGFPVFAVSLALYEKERPLVGVIYDPLRDEMFSAAAGQGARLTSDGVSEILQVSRAATLADSLLATGFPYDRHTSSQNNLVQFSAFLKRTQGIRRAGAATLDMAYVAAGRLDGYWEFKLSSWDVAAGVLLVQEAGGKVTAIDGQPFQLTTPVSLIASNNRLHQPMLELLQSLEPEVSVQT